MKGEWIPELRLAVLGLTGVMVLGSAGTEQSKPCCAISELNARAGTVRARENATGRAFVFKVTDARLFSTLRTGQGVFANFSTHQVSIDGKTACCMIVSIENAAPNGGVALHSGQTTQQPSQSSDSDKSKKKPGGDKRTDAAKSTLGTEGTVVQPLPEGTTEHAIRAATAGGGAPAPCCSITVIDQHTELVSAKVNATGQSFQFRSSNAAALGSMKVGQGVYANFSTRQVSLDGKTICCTIVAMGSAAPSQPPIEKAPKPQSTSVPPVALGGAKNSGALSPPKIQSFSVFPGPIPGGQSSGGKVTLTAPASNTPVIVQLSSDKPEAASVPATVTIQNNNSAPFVITTFGVDKPVDVTIKAQLRGSSDVFTSKMNVRPPQLSTLECSPNQLPSGTPIHCKVWLDGKTPQLQIQGVNTQSKTQGIQVQVTTDKPALASPQTVVVPSGTDRAEFHIPTIGDAQGGPITVFASYQGMTKNALMQLTAALIKNFGCFDGDSALSPSIQGANMCRITPWSQRPYGLIVHLTQAQAQQVAIVGSEPGRAHHASTGPPYIKIRANEAWGGVLWANRSPTDYNYSDYFEPVPQTENHTVTIRDPSSGVTHSVTFVVLRASILGIVFGDTPSSAQNAVTVSSLSGQKLKVWVSFNAPPAPTDWQSQNAWLDVVYGGSADPNLGSVAVQGPTNLAIKEQGCGTCPETNPNCVQSGATSSCDWEFAGRPDLRYFNFQVTVGACSKAENPNGCQAVVKVSSNQAMGSQTGTINVIPQ